ncbi:MAG: hypothetical protein PSX36_14270 [bacterium]|nr:hypothetical protein [bacterium]
MQAADLYNYIENPQLLDESSVGRLQQVVKDFPYFQSAHLLLSLASKKWDASAYQQSLKKTAIVVSNRAHLFELIQKLEYTDSTVPKTAEKLKSSDAVPETKRELEILKETEVAVDAQRPFEMPPEPNPEAELEKEIGKQVVSSFVEKEILKTPEMRRPIAPQEEPENFGDWLSFLKKNQGQSYSEIEQEVNKSRNKEGIQEKTPQQEPNTAGKDQSRKQKNKAIIDRIIDRNPGLIRTKEEQKFYTPDVKAKESLLENEHLVTETLARIYALQGNLNKAIRAYEILSLKNPQKSAYFASLIQKLKNN